MARHTLPNNEWKGSYLIKIELSLIAVLILFLIVFKVDIQVDSTDSPVAGEQEIVQIEQVVQTKHEKMPPPPPRPQVPVEVPNDEVVEEAVINLNAELDMDEKLAIPPPPRQAADNENDDLEQVFVVVETPPRLIGGLQGLQRMITYPEIARKAGIEGRVYIQFVVDKKGNVTNPQVVRGIGGGCDKEALRVISQAKFKPGMQRGRPVKVQYSMPIIFQLDRTS